MFAASRYLFARRTIATHRPTSSKLAQTDSLGVPLEPTWSVNKLLSSYKTPTISDAELKHMHTLSALIPPEPGTAEHKKLKKEIESLVRLVEAVKLCPTTGADTVADGRIWSEGTGINLEQPAEEVVLQGSVAGGQVLLQHSARAVDDFYTVEADKRVN